MGAWKEDAVQDISEEKTGRGLLSDTVVVLALRWRRITLRSVGLMLGMQKRRARPPPARRPVRRPPVGVVRVRLSLLATHNFWRADSRYMKRDEAAVARRGGGLLAMEVTFL